ncbi:HAD family hydrolase [Singulisphaera sp. PoT]|uniref:HAD family hydrolase n=1 Tax=Singulisphaera sp. PoT TaxID=3411797 RepID=UPI003BF5598A
MLEAVVFDLYGTLLRLDRDSKPFLRFARAVCPEAPRSVVVQSLLLESRDIGDFAKRIGFETFLDTTILDSDLREDLRSARLFADAVATLADLKSRGLRLGLISNLASPYKQPFLSSALAIYFDSLEFSCDAGLRKPDPLFFQRALSALDVEPRKSLMVGDNLRSDYDGALSIGMQAILLNRGDQAISPRVPAIKTLREILDDPQVPG